MAERALRGTRLGATSYENDRNTDLAPRQEVSFDCPNGHHFSVPFAAEAELPPMWECRVCGAMATASTGQSPSPKKVKPPRSHWDMLMERRSVEDLEAVLAERLEVVRERRAMEGRAIADAADRAQRRSALPARRPRAAGRPRRHRGGRFRRGQGRVTCGRWRRTCRAGAPRCPTAPRGRTPRG
jgi:hypothetical protein